jgi:hypothetical protein
MSTRLGPVSSFQVKSRRQPQVGALHKEWLPLQPDDEMAPLCDQVEPPLQGTELPIQYQRLFTQQIFNLSKSPNMVPIARIPADSDGFGRVGEQVAGSLPRGESPTRGRRRQQQGPIGIQ